MSEKTVEQRLQELEEGDEELTLIVKGLMTKTLAFQAVLTSLIKLSPLFTVRTELMQEIETRFEKLLESDPGIRSEIEAILSDIFRG